MVSGKSRQAGTVRDLFGVTGVDAQLVALDDQEARLGEPGIHSMKLTASKLRLLYIALCQFPPFQGRKMPPPEEIDFRLSRSTRMFGSYDTGCDGHEITISTAMCKTLPCVIETLLHEMVHLSLEKAGASNHSDHDAEFNRLAATVCNELGYNFPTF